MKEVISSQSVLCRVYDLISIAKSFAALCNRFVVICVWFCFISLSLRAEIHVSSNTIFSLDKKVFVSIRDTTFIFTDVGQGATVGDESKIFIVRGTIVQNLQTHSGAEIIYIPASEGVCNLSDCRRKRLVKFKTGKNNIKPGKEHGEQSKLKASKSFGDSHIPWSGWGTLVTSSLNAPVKSLGAIRASNDPFSLKEIEASDQLKSKPSYTLRKTSFFVLSKHTTRPPPLMISKHCKF